MFRCDWIFGKLAVLQSLAHPARLMLQSINLISGHIPFIIPVEINWTEKTAGLSMMKATVSFSIWGQLRLKRMPMRYVIFCGTDKRRNEAFAPRMKLYTD
jgi:hypothetical protein